VHLGYGIEAAVEVFCCFTVIRLKCNAGKVCNCLIQFLLTMVLSIEQRVFLVEYVFREGNRYTDLVQKQFDENFLETPLPVGSSKICSVS
jgi:hypothetical protein